MPNKKQYHISLDFQSILLPSVRDVLVLCKKYPQGKHGVMEAFRFIAPDEFEMFDISNEVSDVAEAILVNKKILKKISLEGLIYILKEQVFPYLSPGEAIKVDLDLRISSSINWSEPVK